MRNTLRMHQKYDGPMNRQRAGRACDLQSLSVNVRAFIMQFFQICCVLVNFYHKIVRNKDETRDFIPYTPTEN